MVSFNTFYMTIFLLLAAWTTLTLWMMKPLHHQQDLTNVESKLANIDNVLQDLKLSIERREVDKYQIDVKTGKPYLTKDVNVDVMKGDNVDVANDDYADVEYLLHKLQSLSRAENNMQEMWYFIKSQLAEFSTKTSEAAAKDDISWIKNMLGERKNVLLNDLERIRVMLNEKVDKWKGRAHRRLADIVQKRILQHQHPQDCGENRKKVGCRISNQCGFGCSVHHIVFCMIVAYATNRTMILDDSKFQYSDNAMSLLFQRLFSNNCRKSVYMKDVHFATSCLSEDQITTKSCNDVLQLNLRGINPTLKIKNRAAFFPRAIPSSLAELKKYHPDPVAWWIGQFVGYVLRYNNYTLQHIAEYDKQINFTAGGRPIVGIHVRRTDHVPKEAQKHEVEEYMGFVDDYFDRRDLEAEKNGEQPPMRRVYVATDEPQVVAEIKNTYGHRYDVLADDEIAASAATESRYSMKSLLGVVVNVHFLSECDYIVCTFSSQVCRLAYERMSSIHADTRGMIHSIDDVYYYGGQSLLKHITRFKNAGMPHPSINMGQMSFDVGEKIIVYGNHWNGYSKATTLDHCNSKDLYPSYKAEEFISVVDFDKYLHQS